MHKKRKLEKHKKALLRKHIQKLKDEAARREEADAATTTTQSPVEQPVDVDAASRTNPNYENTYQELNYEPEPDSPPQA